MQPETVGSRIRALRYSRKPKMTQAILGKICGVSATNVTEWEKNSYLPKHEALTKLADEFGVTTDFILYGIGSADGTDGSISPTKNAIPTGRVLPVLTWVQSGIWTDSPSVVLEEVTEWLPALPGSGKRSYYLKNRGSSNLPHFEEGELLCIDPDIPLDNVQTGEMIVAMCEQKETFKALVIEPDGSYYLKALNPEFKPNIIQLTQECTYIGKYVGSYKPSKKYF